MKTKQKNTQTSYTRSIMIGAPGEITEKKRKKKDGKDGKGWGRGEDCCAEL